MAASAKAPLRASVAAPARVRVATPARGAAIAARPAKTKMNQNAHHPAPRRRVRRDAAAEIDASAAELETNRTVDAKAMQAQIDNFQRVSVLAEALPYLQRFAGETVVVKYGGAAMKDESLKDRVIRDLVLLSTVGIRPVLVHGGGPEINQWLNKVGIEAKFLNGLRVTDAATMEIVEMVLGASSILLSLTPVPVRPRSRRELHSLRTFSPGVRSSPPTHPTVSSIPTRAPRCLATQTDARPNSRRRPEIESLRFARNFDRT